MRKVIVNYKEEGTSIIEKDGEVKFIIQGRGHYPIPVAKFLKNLKQNNPELLNNALKEGLGIDVNQQNCDISDDVELTPEVVSRVKKKLLRDKIHRFETTETKLPNWVLIDRLWKEFNDGSFTLSDVKKNIEFPNIKSQTYLPMWINCRLSKLSSSGILKKYRDVDISPRYLYRFTPDWVERFKEDNPIDVYVKFEENIIDKEEERDKDVME